MSSLSRTLTIELDAEKAWGLRSDFNLQAEGIADRLSRKSGRPTGAEAERLGREAAFYRAIVSKLDDIIDANGWNDDEEAA
ncbi:MAG: hypothetical protein ACR652_00765 [Methylocystis sp.]|uniref:hypothetical protein n=1 Tax=Methylocystis sp. TaxID=1911079 RepID=UPI003DA4D85B